MTPEKAIKHIEALIANERRILKLSNENEARHLRKIEALKMAKQALEKQIPKKPTDICTPVVIWGLCPVCKGELNKLGGRANRVFKGYAYCMDCGQALDWSDDE